MTSRSSEQSLSSRRKLPKGSKRISTAIAAIIAAVFAVEGGYVNHPDDPGGETNHGVTVKVARKHGYTGDMRDLTKLKAYEIYRKDYIEKPGFLPLVQIDRNVAEEVIDTAVNMGPARPSRFFQRAIREVCLVDLPVDGQVGPVTVDVWEECRRNGGPAVCSFMIENLDRQQEAEYDRLVSVNPRLRKFRRGWQNHRIGNVDWRRCYTPLVEKGA